MEESPIKPFPKEYLEEHRQRVRGATLRFLIGLALGIAFFFVPFLNAVATPFFIIGGAYMAWRYRTRDHIPGYNPSP